MYNSKMFSYRHTNKEKCMTCGYFCEKCVQMNNRVDSPHAERDSLCLCCGKSTNGTCGYMMFGKPLEGSTYTQRTLKDGTVNINIRTCPYFERG